MMSVTPINYIELYTTDLSKSKAFYQQHFGWEFTDYGPSYTAFSNAGIEGGFEFKEEIVNGTLIVLYHPKLEEIHDQLQASGTTISVPIFSFPGGRRFHFKDPSGNELAIWSKE